MTDPRTAAPLRPTQALKLGLAILFLAYLTLFAATTFPRSADAESAAAHYFGEKQVDDALRYSFQRKLLFWGGTALELLLLTALAFTSAGRKVADACAWLVGWHGHNGDGAPLRRRLLNLLRFAAVVLLVGAFVFFAREILLLPLRIARIENMRAWGLTERGLLPWLHDYAMSLLLTLAIGGVMLVGLFLLLRWLPRRWWLAAAGLSVAMGVGFAYALPLWINPLFNTFTPLRDPELRGRIADLTRRAGVEVGDVVVMDASRQSKHLNAYFTGFGASRQIVIYDNMLFPLKRTPHAPTALVGVLARPSDGPFLAAAVRVCEQDQHRRALDEIESVLAHEIGHWQHNHIAKGIAMAALGALGAFFVLSRILQWAVGRAPFALRSTADPAAIPLILWLTFVGTWLAMPVEHAVSRAFERQADWASLELAQSAPAFIDCERRMARENIANLAPAQFSVWLFATHPPVLDRIRMAEEWEEQHRSAGVKHHGGRRN